VDNVLLSSLSKTEIQSLSLKEVELKSGQLIYEADSAVDAVYFPRGSIISLVATLLSGETVEAAMVGRDGIVGASAALDGRISLSRAIVQISGPATVCTADALKELAMKSPKLLSLIIRHEQAVYAQAQQSAACNVTHNVESRLARWMLRARDLSNSNTLPFTQEFLAEMLGVQRTSVSLVAHHLQQAGLIKYTRGNIQITDADGLHTVACECYDTVKQRYSGLLGI
jgi:CRP-like cAMP-binding protein